MASLPTLQPVQVGQMYAAGQRNRLATQMNEQKLEANQFKLGALRQDQANQNRLADLKLNFDPSNPQSVEALSRAAPDYVKNYMDLRAGMAENEREALDWQTTRTARIARTILNLPPEQRPQAYEHFMPVLARLGHRDLPQQWDARTEQLARVYAQLGREDLLKAPSLSSKGQQLLEAGYQPGSPEFQSAMRRQIEGKDSATQREIQNLVSRGVPEEWASDVARGNVTTEIDQFGNVLAINRATGEVRTLSGQGQPDAEPVGAQGNRQPAAGSGVLDVIEQGVGPVSVIKQLASNVIGPFVDGAIAPETTRAKTAIRAFNQEAKTAFVNNPRFPVAEQQLVAELLPDPSAFFNDPDAARQNLLQLREFLETKLRFNEQSIASGNPTQDKVGELSNQNESIRRIIGMMGSPGTSHDIGDMSFEQLQQLDLKSLSEEELRQASQRFEELSGGN